MKEVIDNFSTDSASYATFRPESPVEIFDFLNDSVKSFGTAWDCGTGNGQVAVKLAERFGKVYGTDISTEQLGLAQRRDNITYLNERAERTTLPDNSVDLITIAQAIHWFDFDKFYAEVRRVARPGALIAAWTYSTPKLTAAVDEVVNHFYEDITGPYWDKERAYVDAGYSTIPFPFEETKTPGFKIVKDWDMQQFLGYLRTWSGVKHYMRLEHKDPTALMLADLEQAWGSGDALAVKWPVHIRAGIIR